MRTRTSRLLTGAFFGLLVLAAAHAARPQSGDHKGPSIISPRGPSLLMPTLNAARGRELFARRGCVICHSVNGVGGMIGPKLDATESVPYVNPFDFAARMWRGADAMITLQEAEIGFQIEIDGDELADITAFAHDIGEQRKFSESDIPRSIRRMMKERKL